MVAPILRHPSLVYRAGQRIALARSAWLTLSLVALACGEAATPEPPDQDATARSEAPAAQWRFPTPLLAGNQLRNPDFEAGTQGWGRIERRDSVGFEVVSEPVHSGHGAAHLVASWQPGSPERPVSLRSAIQEISPPRFPDRIAGWYRVDRWEDTSDPGALQLQILVFVIGDPRTREIVRSDDPDDPEVHPKLDNFQLRYQLAGPTEVPEDGGNVRHRVIGKGPPDWEAGCVSIFPSSPTSGSAGAACPQIIGNCGSCSRFAGMTKQREPRYTRTSTMTICFSASRICEVRDLPALHSLAPGVSLTSANQRSPFPTRSLRITADSRRLERGHSVARKGVSR